MRKTLIFLTVLTAGLLCVTACGRKNEVLNDNTIYAGPGQVDETAARPASAEIIIDASVSMKPYFNAADPGIVQSISALRDVVGVNTPVFFQGNPKPFTGLMVNIAKSVNAQVNKSTSTFEQYFSKAAARIDTCDVMMCLVTDGIMSLGSGVDTKAALRELRGRIAASLSGHSNLAAAVLRYTGAYQGNYWNSLNDSKPTAKGGIQRPYFIIVLGQKQALRWLAEQPLTELNNPTELFFGIQDIEGYNRTSQRSKVLAKANPTAALKLNVKLPAGLAKVNPETIKFTNNGRVLPLTPEVTNGVLKVTVPTDVRLSQAKSGDKTVTVNVVIPKNIDNRWTTAWSTDNDTEDYDAASGNTFGLAALIEGMEKALQPETEIMKLNLSYLAN